MHSILAWNVQNCVGFWGSAPDPAGGAYDAPPYPLVGRGFLPWAIAALRLRHMQFPRLTCLYAKKSNISCPEFTPSTPTVPRFCSPPIYPTTWNPLKYALTSLGLVVPGIGPESDLPASGLVWSMNFNLEENLRSLWRPAAILVSVCHVERPINQFPFIRPIQSWQIRNFTL